MRITRIILTVFLVCYLLFIALVIFDLFCVTNADFELMRTDYNYELRDPTYSEMREFLARDETDLNKPSNVMFFEYDCSNFARDVKRNAIKEGIRCAGVILWFKEWGHAIVAFSTTDRGIIFIEPQSDAEVEIGIGLEYLGNTISKYWMFWPTPKNCP